MYSIITYNDHLCFVGNQFLINVLTIEKYGTKKKNRICSYSNLYDLKSKYRFKILIPTINRKVLIAQTINNFIAQCAL